MRQKIEERSGPIEIDLTGPDGNVFSLMGRVKDLLRISNRDASEKDQILYRMRSSDYKNAVAVFDEEFGDIVLLLE